MPAAFLLGSMGLRNKARYLDPMLTGIGDVRMTRGPTAGECSIEGSGCSKYSHQIGKYLSYEKIW